MGSDGSPSRNALYADLFDRLLDPVFLLDQESFKIIDVNPAGERVLGSSRKSLLNKELLIHLSDKDHDDFLKALRIAKRRYHPRAHHFWFHDLAEGDSALMEMVIGGIHIGEAEAVEKKEAIQIICRDITRQHEAETALEEQLSRMEVLNRRLEELSTTDELTGLANYRHFSEKLGEEHRRCSRYGGTYSLVFCDLDHFKHYNDKNGHPAGDALLKQIGAILRDLTRDSDLPARYGGEEFAILCPETPPEGAARLSERIHEALTKQNFPHSETQPLGKISMSCGVASYPAHGTEWKDILKAADEALYRSKESGRARTTLADAPQK